MKRAGNRKLRRVPLEALVIAAGVAGWILPAIAGEQTSLPNTVAPWGGDTVVALQRWIIESYETAPALVLGLAALLSVPPLAVVGLMLRRGDGADPNQTHLIGRGRSRRRDAHDAPEVGLRDPSETARPMRGQLQVYADGYAARYFITSPVTRIGREADNEVRIDDMTVHRYHAVVSWSDDTGFEITDLSSESGNGMLVNGSIMARAALGYGDEIELGQARIKFVPMEAD